MGQEAGRTTPRQVVPRRHLTLSVLTVVALAVASAVAAVVGWRYGVAHLPIDPGCGCGPDLGVLGAALLFGLLGALAGILVVGAVFGAAGLVLYLRHRRDAPPPEASAELEDAGVEQWWPGARQ